jgi:hypothetical protein
MDVAAGQLAVHDVRSSCSPHLLRSIAIGGGIAWALAFVAVGGLFHLQMYADGAIFSYGIAVGESWAIHWHNIPARFIVYLACVLPAEIYARWTGDVAGAIGLYGALFYGAQAVGLACTFLLDRSRDRFFFTIACASTACLCPLVFGFPTEMWLAHAIFWPALALFHGRSGGCAGYGARLLTLLALVFTHEGALVLAAAIVLSTLLRGWRSTTFLVSLATFALTVAIWLTVKATMPPDEYFAPVLANARLHFFDPAVFVSGIFAELSIALLCCFGLFLVFRSFGAAAAIAAPSTIVILGLSAYWLEFGPALHTENRYFLRTALVLGTPCFGMLAAALALPAGESRTRWLDRLPIFAPPGRSQLAIAAVATIVVTTAVHAVEAARFVKAWTGYTAAVRDLATGSASDARLGDPRFVSSDRIALALHPLAWSSTTPFLAVLLAPGYRPARLVVDATAGYFWMNCALTIENGRTARPIPASSLDLIRTYTCLHRHNGRQK